MKDGDWRMFNIDKREAMANHCHEMMRMHLMEHAFGVSFGFVEQRVKRQPENLIDDEVQFVVYCGHANLNYEPVQSLRDGMNILEWLWQNRKEKEHEDQNI